MVLGLIGEGLTSRQAGEGCCFAGETVRKCVSARAGESGVKLRPPCYLRGPCLGGLRASPGAARSNGCMMHAGRRDLSVGTASTCRMARHSRRPASCRPRRRDHADQALDRLVISRLGASAIYRFWSRELGIRRGCPHPCHMRAGAVIRSGMERWAAADEQAEASGGG